MYADLSGADGSLATLDYGDDPGVDAFFVGRQVQLDELGVEGLEGWSQRKVAAKRLVAQLPGLRRGPPAEGPGEHRPRRLHLLRLRPRDARGRRLGGEVRGPRPAPEGPVQAAPPARRRRDSPGADPTRSSGRSSRPARSTASPTTGASTSSRRRSPRPTTGSSSRTATGRSSSGIAAGEVSTAPRLAVWRGTRYRHFQATTARVEAVLGEFYWEVKKGETTDVSDYVAPPRILSEEKYANEVTWSEGSYVPKEEVEQAFALKTPLPAPEGVGSNQPWPHAGVVPRLHADDGALRRDRPLPLRLLQHQGRPEGRLPDAPRPLARRPATRRSPPTRSPRGSRSSPSRSRSRTRGTSRRGSTRRPTTAGSS